MVDDALDQVLQRLVEHDQTSGLATSAAAASPMADLSAFSAFGSAFCSALSAFAVLGSPLSALSALSAFGSGLSAFGSALSAFGSAFFLVVAPAFGSDIADLVAASYSAVLS